MKKLTLTQHLTGKARIAKAVRNICAPILADYHARMDALHDYHHRMLQHRNINTQDPMQP